MPTCSLCGRDPEHVDVREEDGEVFHSGGHACHCVREGGRRVAVGICCGKMLGAELLAEEERSE